MTEFKAMAGESDQDDRYRLTIEFDDELVPVLKDLTDTEGARARNVWINQTLRQSLKGEMSPFQFVVPKLGQPRSVDTLGELLNTAEDEIICVESSLSDHTAVLEPLFKEKIAQRSSMTMTFITIDPNLSTDAPLYKVLTHQLGHTERVEQLMQRVRETAQILRGLRDFSRNHLAAVSVRGAMEVPLSGLFVVDPGTKRRAIRLEIHPSSLHDDRNSYVDIRGDNPVAAAAETVIMRNYYNPLRDRSPEVPE